MPEAKHRQPSMEYHFHDRRSLEQASEQLGARAMGLGLLSNLTIHRFSDCWQFLIADGETSKCLTPEEAYLYFKRLLAQAR